MIGCVIPPLVPPLRFSLVEEGIYRGAYPSLTNYRFLKRLQLCSIVSLLPEEPTQDLLDWCEANKVQCHHRHVTVFRDEITLTHERAAELLQLVISADRQPVYLHCLDGGQVTGVIIMCLRKLQRWSMPPASNEFARFMRKGSNDTPLQTPAHVLLFVSNFRPDLEFSRCLPDSVPRWLAIAVGLVAPGEALPSLPLHISPSSSAFDAATEGSPFEHPTRGGWRVPSYRASGESDHPSAATIAAVAVSAARRGQTATATPSNVAINMVRNLSASQCSRPSQAADALGLLKLSRVATTAVSLPPRLTAVRELALPPQPHSARIYVPRSLHLNAPGSNSS